jgi:hypothetical protein
MAKGKEVTVAKGTDVAERPDWMGDGKRGSEEVSINDLTIPRLVIIQDLSPQHKKNKAEYIENAEVGMIFNTVTNELYGNQALFVPVYFRLEWVVWKHRDAGGGFVGAYPTQEEAVAAVGEHPNAGQTTEKGDPVIEVQDTAQHFGLLLDPNSSLEDPRAAEIVISMSRSQLKPSRQFNSQIKLAGGDRWERYYRLSAIEAQNQAGQDYYNWKVEQLGFVSEAVFAQAESLYEAVKAGTRDVERNDPQASQQEEADDDNM